MRRRKNITVDRLGRMSHPTLEDILAFLNGGRYRKFFLERPKVYPDGSVEEFTAAGSRIYRRLVAVLYAVERLTQMTATHKGGYTIEGVVEELDSITNE